MNEFNVLHKNKKIQKSIAIVMFFIMIFSCVPNVFANDDKSLEQASEKAISWLESKQNTDGSYGQYTTKIRDTSIVSEYLKTNNLLTEVVSKAEGWAVDQKASNIDFASYLIDIVNESSKKQELIEYLVAAQNSDGGWGIDVGFESDCFDTILALKALSKHYSLDKGVLLNGLGFLISAQNQDGSWAYTSGGKGTASITAQAILLMNDIAPKYNNYVLTAVNKGIEFLKALQRSDGSWGMEESNIMDTILAYRAMIRNDGAANVMDLPEKVLKLQKENGSWYDNPMITVNALIALTQKKAEEKPEENPDEGSDDEPEENPEQPVVVKDELKEIKIFKKQKDPENPMSFIDIETYSYKMYENLMIDVSYVIANPSESCLNVYLKSPSGSLIELMESNGRYVYETSNNQPGSYTVIARIKNMKMDYIVQELQKQFEIVPQFELDGIKLKMSASNSWKGQPEKEVSVTATILSQSNTNQKVKVVTNIVSDKYGSISSRTSELECDISGKTDIEVAKFIPKTTEEGNYTITSSVYLNDQLLGKDSAVFKVYPPLPPSKVEVRTKLEKDWLQPGKDELTVDFEIKGMGTSTETNTGVDMVVLLDESGSMDGDPLIKEKEASKKIVELIKNNDKCQIISFDSYPVVRTEFTNNVEELKKSIDNIIEDGGGTNIDAGLNKAIEQITKASTPEREKIIVLLSDGGSDRSIVMDVVDKAVEKGIIIHTLGMGNGVDQELLRDIAKTSGGIYRYSSTADQLEDMLMEIGQQVFNTAGKDVMLSLDIPKDFNKDQLEFTPEPQTLINNQDGSITVQWNYPVIIMGQKKGISIKFKGDSFLQDTFVTLLSKGKLSYIDQNETFMEEQVDEIKIYVNKYRIESSITLDKEKYSMNEDVRINISSKNITNYPCKVSGTVDIFDNTGKKVANVTTKDIFEWESLEEVTLDGKWNCGKTMTGNYKVKVTWKEGDKVIAWNEKEFAIVPNGKIGNTVFTDKAVYNSNENVNITGSIYNTSTNEIGKDLTIRTQVMDLTGKEIWKEEKTIKELLPNGKEVIKGVFSANDLFEGSYSIISKVYSPSLDGTEDVLLSECVSSFIIRSSKEEGAGLTGSMQLTSSTIKTNVDIGVNLELSNNGNSDLDRIERIIQVIDPKTEKISGSYSDKIDMKKGTVLKDTRYIKHDGIVSGDYLVEFLVRLPDGNIVPISSKYLKIEAGTIVRESNRSSSKAKANVTVTDDSIPGATVQDLGISLSADKTKYKEGDIVEFTITYINKLNVDTGSFEIVAEIPENTILQAGNNGEVIGNKIKWKIDKLKAGAREQIKYFVKLGTISAKEETVSNTASIESLANLINKEDDSSTIQVLVVSDRFGALSHKAYIKGYGDGTFRADKQITRAEAATILANIMELDVNATETSKYSDVSSKHWAKDYIEAVTSAGLFRGYGDNTFKPDAPITRAEFAAVLFKYKKLPDVVPVVEHYSDIGGHWAKNYIEEIARIKLIAGYEDGTFRPNGEIKRSEAVVMINRMLNRGPLMVQNGSFEDVSKEHWAFGQIEEAVIDHKSMVDANGNEVPVN